jgi:hypothetical protein
MADHGQYLEKIVKAFKIIKKNISKYSSRERKEPDNLFCNVCYVHIVEMNLVLSKLNLLQHLQRKINVMRKPLSRKLR